MFVEGLGEGEGGNGSMKEVTAPYALRCGYGPRRLGGGGMISKRDSVVSLVSFYWLWSDVGDRQPSLAVRSCEDGHSLRRESLQKAIHAVPNVTQKRVHISDYKMVVATIKCLDTVMLYDYRRK